MDSGVKVTRWVKGHEVKVTQIMGRVRGFVKRAGICTEVLSSEAGVFYLATDHLQYLMQ